jgi:hypothetical protein
MCRLLDAGSGDGTTSIFHSSGDRTDLGDIVTVEEAAKALGRDIKWIKRARLPFVKRISRKNSLR